MCKEWKVSEGYVILEVEYGKVFVYYTNNAWYADTPGGKHLNIKFDSMERAIKTAN